MRPSGGQAVPDRPLARPIVLAGAIFCVFPAAVPAAGGTPVPVPSPRSTRVPDRLHTHREILDLKLRAARDPASAPSVRDRLARIYLESGEPEKAVSLYRQAIVFDRPRAASYHREIARIYRLQDREDEAEEELRRAAAASPARATDRRRSQLAAWETEGRDDLLLQQYRFLYWTRAGSPERYLGEIARLLSARGETEEAERYYRLLITDYRRRIVEKPDRAADYHLRIAGVYENMQDYDAAAREYRRAAESEKGEGGAALIRQADFYRSRGETERALDLYREAQTRPGVNLSALRLKIASLLEREGEDEAALTELRRAAEEGEGERGRIGLQIARHLDRRGELEAALAEYRLVLPELDPPARVRIWERIGALLFRLGREEEGREAYREAFRLHGEESGDGVASVGFLEKAVDLAGKAGLAEEEEIYSRRLLETYRLLLDRDPARAGHYHRRLADLLQRRGDYSQAAAHCRSWSALAPDDPQPHYRLYRLYRDFLDNPRGAERHRERYRELREANRGSDPIS